MRNARGSAKTNVRSARSNADEAPGADASIPLYDSVARTLKEEIVNGAYPVGTQLPTESALRQRFNVSRHTVRDALRILRDEGLVTSRQGSGTVVVPPPASDSFHLEASSVDDLMAYSSSMYTEVRSTTTAVVEGKLAARLGVASGKEWLIVRGLVRPNSKQLPVCWSDYYIHLDYAAVGRLLPARHLGPIFVLIEDYYAIRILEIEQQMSASTMSPALAGILKAKPGTTGIELRRTYYTTGGKLVQISLHTHPAPRFCHSMKMRRIKT